MAVLGKNTKNIFAAATAAISLAALTPQFATQAHAEDVKLVAATTSARPQLTLHVGADFNERRVASIVRGLSRDNIPVKVISGFDRPQCLGLLADGVLLSTFGEKDASRGLHSDARTVYYDGGSIIPGLQDGPCAVQG